jgi:hypothetical protein
VTLYMSPYVSSWRGRGKITIYILATAVVVKMNMYKCFIRSLKLALLSVNTEHFV